jgi:hypothetical protein
MRILMHDNHLGNRGTTAALIDYAEQLTLLGHAITVCYKKSDVHNSNSIVKKLSEQFELREYASFSDIAASEQKLFDKAYFIKSGFNDEIWFKNTSSIIHSVFQYFEPHGQKYAYVSKWLANAVRKKAFLHGIASADLSKTFSSFRQNSWVPHMVNLPPHNDNLRKDLKIPEDALVGIRYGGRDTFDIPFVHDLVRSLLESNSNFWFIAVNTNEFFVHPRLIYLPTFSEKDYKVCLLNTANFFLHARSNGESFGLSILEAMWARVPVLSWKGGIDKNHTYLLSPNSMYGSRNELKRQIENLSNYKDVELNFAVSARYLPNRVMELFQKEFEI